MATRLYFPAATPATISPAFDSGWEDTNEAVRRRLNHVKGNSALADGSSIVYLSTQDGLDRQYISYPMNKGISFSAATVKMQIMAKESNAGDDATSRLGIRILSRDGGTVRQTLLSVAQYGPETEYITTNRNKTFANGDTVTGTYVTEDGDRLCVEIGHSDTVDLGTSIDVTCNFGEVGTDLAENETATSGNGWIEFSNTIIFQPEQPPQPINYNKYLPLWNKERDLKNRGRKTTKNYDSWKTIIVEQIPAINHVWNFYKQFIPTLYRKRKLERSRIKPSPPFEAWDRPISGLVTWIRFDNDVLDYKDANNGTITGTPTYVTGRLSEAGDFGAGKITYVTLANESHFDFERTNSFSVAFWINGTSVGVIEPLVGKKSTGATLGWDIRFTAGSTTRIRLMNTTLISDLDVNYATVNLRDGKWHHLVFTYDGSSDASGLKLYVDGTSVSLTIVTNNLSSTILNDIPVVLGAFNDDGVNTLTGKLDDVRIHNRVITADEVRSLYAFEPKIEYGYKQYQPVWLKDKKQDKRLKQITPKYSSWQSILVTLPLISYAWNFYKIYLPEWNKKRKLEKTRTKPTQQYKSWQFLFDLLRIQKVKPRPHIRKREPINKPNPKYTVFENLIKLLKRPIKTQPRVIRKREPIIRPNPRYDAWFTFFVVLTAPIRDYAWEIYHKYLPTRIKKVKRRIIRTPTTPKYNAWVNLLRILRKEIYKARQTYRKREPVLRPTPRYTLWVNLISLLKTIQKPKPLVSKKEPVIRLHPRFDSWKAIIVVSLVPLINYPYSIYQKYLATWNKERKVQVRGHPTTPRFSTWSWNILNPEVISHLIGKAQQILRLKPFQWTKPNPHKRTRDTEPKE